MSNKTDKVCTTFMEHCGCPDLCEPCLAEDEALEDYIEDIVISEIDSKVGEIMHEHVFNAEDDDVCGHSIKIAIMGMLDDYDITKKEN
jgi:hypothetical protein